MKKQETSTTESSTLSRLISRPDLFAPLKLAKVEARPKSAPSLDARITLSWRGRSFPFLAAIKTRTAPSIVRDGIWQLKSLTAKRENPLLIVPHLSKTIIEMLEREGISGLDLNGNYLIQTKEFAAIRLDRPNAFAESQPIKKIFSGNSAIVGRLFLLEKRRFETVNEVFAAVKERGGSLSLPTVSKVLKGLEEELMIEKGEKGIALLQPGKLLLRLQEEYRPPKVTARMRLKLPDSADGIVDAMRAALPESARWAFSGESSAQQYAVTTRPGEFAVYASGFGDLARYEENRFPNITVLKTQDSFPFFGRSMQAGFPWSSELQCYLELSRLDKRERELADAVREAILKRFK